MIIKYVTLSVFSVQEKSFIPNDKVPMADREQSAPHDVAKVSESIPTAEHMPMQSDRLHHPEQSETMSQKSTPVLMDHEKPNMLQVPDQSQSASLTGKSSSIPV